MSPTPPPHPETTSHPGTAARGLARPWDPRVWGTFVGAAGGTVFVWTSSADLDAPLTLAARTVWAVAFLAYVWFVLVHPRPFVPVADVPRRAGLVYLLSVAGMLLLIRVGTAVLTDLDRAELRPALIVVAVGAHFLPFAGAFRTPLFWSLGWTMVVLGLVGVAGGWVRGASTAAAVTVVAGIVMLLAIAWDAATTGRRAASDGVSGT